MKAIITHYYIHRDTLSKKSVIEEILTGIFDTGRFFEIVPRWGDGEVKRYELRYEPNGEGDFLILMFGPTFHDVESRFLNTFEVDPKKYDEMVSAMRDAFHDVEEERNLEARDARSDTETGDTENDNEESE